MPLSTNQTHQLLRNLGHTPNKRLGQNFLVDGNIVRKSLQIANVELGDKVVEIGPGLGTLTKALLEAQVEVFAIEKDTRLAHHLQQTLVPCYPNTLHLTIDDAMDHPLASLPVTVESFKIIANLPYAIATPWLEAVLKGPHLPTQMVLMLQKETADRFTSQPGRNYGPITILLEAAYTRAPGHAVARSCFYPVPEVDSVLLHLVLKPEPYRFHPDTYACIRQLFTQRRKQIQSLCKRHPMHADVLNEWLMWLATQGIAPDTRPEKISLQGWLELDKLYRKTLDKNKEPFATKPTA